MYLNNTEPYIIKNFPSQRIIKPIDNFSEGKFQIKIDRYVDLRFLFDKSLKSRRPFKIQNQTTFKDLLGVF
jgi:hypothetical protein